MGIFFRYRRIARDVHGEAFGVGAICIGKKLFKFDLKIYDYCGRNIRLHRAYAG